MTYHSNLSVDDDDDDDADADADESLRSERGRFWGMKGKMSSSSMGHGSHGIEAKAGEWSQPLESSQGVATAR